MYARIQNGVVVELFTPPPGVTLAECFHADVAAQFVEVPSGVAPAQGWMYDGKTFAPPPPPPEPTLAQQAAALLARGLAVTSTATPALNATYPTTPTAQQQVIAEITSILLNGAFADGASTIEWPDVTGGGHAFDVVQFKALATAIAAFVSGCVKCINGQSTTLPSATATIP
jgi:hypothetical protein